MIFAEVHINLCLFWHKERVPTQVSTGELGGSHPVGSVPPQKKVLGAPPQKKTLSTTQKMSNSFIFMQLSATFIPPVRTQMPPPRCRNPRENPGHFYSIRTNSIRTKGLKLPKI